MDGHVGVARARGLVTQDVGDEVVVYDPATDTTHALSATASAVFRACDGTTSVAQMSATASAFLGTHVSSDVILLTLDELADSGLVTLDPAEPSGLSRRSMLTKIGTGAAVVVAAPVVQSIVSPAIAAAASLGDGDGDPVVCTPTTTIVNGSRSGSLSATPGWRRQATASGGSVANSNEYGAPSGFGGPGCYAAVLKTGPLTASRAQVFSASKAGMKVSDIAGPMGYWAYKASTSGPGAAHAALQIELRSGGSGVPATILVYEPYLKQSQTVVLNTWQYWNAGNGLWRSTQLGFGNNPGQANNPQPWSWVLATYGNRLIGNHGFNLGTSNENTHTAVDGLTFDGVTTNF